MPCLHEDCVHRLFSLHFCWCCTQNIDIVKLKFSLPFSVVELLHVNYTYSFFDNISHTVCKKKWPYTSWSFLGLYSSYVFTFDHLFTHRSDVFNNLPISFTKWPEYRKNRCLSCSTNSVRLHFHERVEKTKESCKNMIIENLKNEQEIYGGKKIVYICTFGAKIKEILYFLQKLILV